MRRHVQLCLAERPFVNILAILANDIGHFQLFAQIGKVHHIAQLEATRAQIFFNNAHRTQHVFVLLQTGVRRAVGIYQTIHAEVAVVREFAEIAAVVILLAPVYGVAHVNSVVAPFPYEAAAMPLVAVEATEVVL